jgi:hypothetical protein
MRYIFFGYLVILLLSCNGKEEHKFKLLMDEGVTQASPVSLDLESLGIMDRGWLDNVALTNEGRKVPFQAGNKGKSMMFLHAPENTTEYKLQKTEGNTGDSDRITIHKTNGNLKLIRDNRPVLSYRYEMTYPPQGVDSIFRKSGYIHPLLSPFGDTLSRIQPPDHYHHYGIWGPWTHTRIEGERVDFWNLAEQQGTVLFKDFNDTFSGPLYGGFSAYQEHISLKAEKDKRIAINENLEVKVWDLGRPDRYMVDYTSQFNSPLENGILLEAYRYGGGLGMRFTERWHKDNCSVLTSEGNDRLTADGTNARWCMVTGASADGSGTNGVLFLSYPENRAHPEPMRVWPLDGNGGRGDMFFEFCPIRHEEWKIEPNKDYRLKYRMVVFEGKLTVQEAESYWKSFASNPKIVIE